MRRQQLIWSKLQDRRTQVPSGLIVIATILCLLFPSAASAERYALVVGNNRGGPDEETLQHAESDARRMQATFTDVSRVRPENLILVEGGNASELRRAFELLAYRIRRDTGDTLFFFFFSGHADGSGLHLGDDRIDFKDLRKLLIDVPADARVAVLDACQAGILTRTKGGAQGQPFAVGERQEAANGLAILASTTDREFAQESDTLRGSFFTHHFEAALRGLADRNKNGQVSLSEAFDYAATQTLTSTSRTSAGPQHASFRYDITGVKEPVLAFPRVGASGYAFVILDQPGWYLIYTDSGELVSEFQSAGADTLPIPAGQFEVVQRSVGEVRSGKLSLVPGQRLSVSHLTLHKLSFGQEVRKGMTRTDASYAGVVLGTARSSLFGLGNAYGAAVRARIDGRFASLEVGAAFAKANSSTHMPAETSELGASVTLLRLWDWTSFSAATGLELEWSAVLQSIPDSPSTTTSIPALGPLVLVESEFSRLIVRFDIGVPWALARLSQTDGTQEWKLAPAVRARVGVGVYF